MALPLVLASLFGRAISLVRHRQKSLFLDDQQLASTEAQIRAVYRDIIPRAAPAPFDGAWLLSLLPRYRERQMISCLYFANLLGFEHADVVDIDDRGCTNIIHNLNDPGLLEKVGGVRRHFRRWDPRAYFFAGRSSGNYRPVRADRRSGDSPGANEQYD